MHEHAATCARMRHVVLRAAGACTAPVVFAGADALAERQHGALRAGGRAPCAASFGVAHTYMTAIMAHTYVKIIKSIASRFILPGVHAPNLTNSPLTTRTAGWRGRCGCFLLGDTSLMGSITLQRHGRGRGQVQITCRQRFDQPLTLWCTQQKRYAGMRDIK